MFSFTVYELRLLIEALEARASRLESYARYGPDNAGPNERKAEAMRKLRDKLLSKKSRLGGVGSGGYHSRTPWG